MMYLTLGLLVLTCLQSLVVVKMQKRILAQQQQSLEIVEMINTAAQTIKDGTALINELLQERVQRWNPPEPVEGPIHWKQIN